MADTQQKGLGDFSQDNVSHLKESDLGELNKKLEKYKDQPPTWKEMDWEKKKEEPPTWKEMDWEKQSRSETTAKKYYPPVTQSQHESNPDTRKPEPTAIQKLRTKAQEYSRRIKDKYQTYKEKYYEPVRTRYIAPAKATYHEIVQSPEYQKAKVWAGKAYAPIRKHVVTPTKGFASEVWKEAKIGFAEGKLQTKESVTGEVHKKARDIGRLPITAAEKFKARMGWGKPGEGRGAVQTQLGMSPIERARAARLGIRQPVREPNIKAIPWGGGLITPMVSAREIRAGSPGGLGTGYGQGIPQGQSLFAMTGVYRGGGGGYGGMRRINISAPRIGKVNMPRYSMQGGGGGRSQRFGIPHGIIKPYWSKKLKKLARTNVRRFGVDEGLGRTRQIAAIAGWKMQ